LKLVKQDKQFNKREETDLTEIVRKFLISENNIEEFISDAKKIINFPLEKAANIGPTVKEKDNYMLKFPSFSQCV